MIRDPEGLGDIPHLDNDGRGGHVASAACRAGLIVDLRRRAHRLPCPGWSVQGPTRSPGTGLANLTGPAPATAEGASARSGAGRGIAYRGASVPASAGFVSP